MGFTPLKISNDAVFGEYRYLDPLKLYMTYFSAVPSTLQSNYIMVEEVLNYMDKQFEGKMINMHSREYQNAKNKTVRNIVVYVLESQVMASNADRFSCKCCLI